MHDVAGPPVTVVLVHWNQPDRCARTVEAFHRQGVPVRILIVDNGSEERKLQRMRDLVDADEGVTIIEVGHNAGFGPGANVGFCWWLAQDPSLSSDWVALAPHDALPADGTLKVLIDTAEEQDRAGLACADVGDGHVPVVDPYFGGITMPVADPDHVGWEDVDYPHGTLLIARRGCLEDIGLFDERYFAYCEEADLGLRAKAQSWRVGLVRGARVTNPTMRSGSPAVDYLMQRNTLLLVRDHSGRYHVTIRFLIGIWQLTRGLVKPSPGTFVFSPRGRALGMLDFLRGRFGSPPEAMFSEAGEPAARSTVGMARN